MIPSYGERWGDVSITADVVGETMDAHIVDVSVHDRVYEISVKLKVYKGREWFGTMIPWVAVRLVIADLAATAIERVRRIEGKRLIREVWPVDVGQYLEELDRYPTLAAEVAYLPDYVQRAHMMYLDESPEDETGLSRAKRCLHNARKLIFDKGLPEHVDFYYSRKDAKVSVWWPLASWFFPCFDWRDIEQGAALEDFIEMLNPWHSIDIEAMKPGEVKWFGNGPKDWSPKKGPAILRKGVDYGPELK